MTAPEKTRRVRYDEPRYLPPSRAEREQGAALDPLERIRLRRQARLLDQHAGRRRSA